MMTRNYIRCKENNCSMLATNYKFPVMEFSSKLFENAVNKVSQLPGIGKRTELRLVLHLLRQPSKQTLHLPYALLKMREGIKLCKNCHRISNVDICEICANPHRNTEIICMVVGIRDVRVNYVDNSFY